jgi:hypothetical protein
LTERDLIGDFVGDVHDHVNLDDQVDADPDRFC